MMLCFMLGFLLFRTEAVKHRFRRSSSAVRHDAACRSDDDPCAATRGRNGVCPAKHSSNSQATQVLSPKAPVGEALEEEKQSTQARNSHAQQPEEEPPSRSQKETQSDEGFFSAAARDFARSGFVGTAFAQLAPTLAGSFVETSTDEVAPAPTAESADNDAGSQVSRHLWGALSMLGLDEIAGGDREGMVKISSSCTGAGAALQRIVGGVTAASESTMSTITQATSTPRRARDEATAEEDAAAGLSSASAIPLENQIRVRSKCPGSLSKAKASFDEWSETQGPFPSSRGVEFARSLCAEAQPEFVLHVLHWARKRNCCSLRLFSEGVRALGNAKHTESAGALFQLLQQEELEPDEPTYQQLMRLAIQAGDLALIQRILGHAPDDISLLERPSNAVALVRLCTQEGDVLKVLPLLRLLRSRGEADATAHNCALDLCVTRGGRAPTKRLFQEMRESGHVDVVSYNILLKRCVGEESSVVDPDELLKDMRQLGLRPNVATYNSMLSAALSQNKVGKAWQVVDAMEGSSQGIDAYTVSILLKGLRRERGVQGAVGGGSLATGQTAGQDIGRSGGGGSCWGSGGGGGGGAGSSGGSAAIAAADFDRILALVDRYAVRVDEVLVNATLEACMSLRDHTRLREVLATLARRGWPAVPKQCTPHTYSTLIKVYGQIGKLQLAWRVFQEAASGSKKAGAASEQIYGHMIDALACNGQHDDALALLSEMRDVGACGGQRPSAQAMSIAYANVIRGFVHSRECAKAVECYEEMRLHGIKVTLVTFNTLVDACCRVGDMESAARLYRDMLDAECLPDLITYSTLVKGYCVRGELDQAMELFALMQTKGIEPDAIVYNSLLDGCAKAQQVVCCQELLLSMEKSGVMPSNHSVSILIKLHGRMHDLDAAFRVLKEMPAKYNFKPNTAVYTCLMSACIANGRMDLAMDLRLQMVSDGVPLDERTFATLLRGALRTSDAERCALLAHEALDAGGVQFLGQEMAENVMALIKRQRLWDTHGRKLQSQLQSRRVWVAQKTAAPWHTPSSGQTVDTSASASAESSDRFCGNKGKRTRNFCSCI